MIVTAETKICYRCGCCPAWLSTEGKWKACLPCKRVWRFHGFGSHSEYDAYLAKGCWVCGEPAVLIDHNHQIGCPKSKHSCELCRRGPACKSCNGLLREGATADMFISRGKRYEELAAISYRLAEALQKAAA